MTSCITEIILSCAAITDNKRRNSASVKGGNCFPFNIPNPCFLSVNFKESWRMMFEPSVVEGQSLERLTVLCVSFQTVTGGPECL